MGRISRTAKTFYCPSVDRIQYILPTDLLSHLSCPVFVIVILSSKNLRVKEFDTEGVELGQEWGLLL